MVINVGNFDRRFQFDEGQYFSLIIKTWMKKAIQKQKRPLENEKNPYKQYPQ
jgi:hypothetical protein